MMTLSQLVVNAGLRERIFTDRQLAWVVEGSAQRRYNLVNRALKAGELVRLSRGLYMLDPGVSGVRLHSFVIAQALRPGSYISFESALAWHGCIPEATRQLRSVVAGRRKARFQVSPYGEFRFFPLAVNPGYLLAGVERHVHAGGATLVAQPLRALLDLCCHRKVEAESLAGLMAGLRLDRDWLGSLGTTDVQRYSGVFRFKRMKQILKAMSEEIVL